MASFGSDVLDKVVRVLVDFGSHGDISMTVKNTFIHATVPQDPADEVQNSIRSASEPVPSMPPVPEDSPTFTPEMCYAEPVPPEGEPSYEEREEEDALQPMLTSDGYGESEHPAYLGVQQIKVVPSWEPAQAEQVQPTRAVPAPAEEKVWTTAAGRWPGSTSGAAGAPGAASGSISGASASGARGPGSDEFDEGVVSDPVAARLTVRHAEQSATEPAGPAGSNLNSPPSSSGATRDASHGVVGGGDGNSAPKPKPDRQSRKEKQYDRTRKYFSERLRRSEQSPDYAEPMGYGGFGGQSAACDTAANVAVDDEDVAASVSTSGAASAAGGASGSISGASASGTMEPEFKATVRNLSDAPGGLADYRHFMEHCQPEEERTAEKFIKRSLSHFFRHHHCTISPAEDAISVYVDLKSNKCRGFAFIKFADETSLERATELNGRLDQDLTFLRGDGTEGKLELKNKTEGLNVERKRWS